MLLCVHMRTTAPYARRAETMHWMVMRAEGLELAAHNYGCDEWWVLLNEVTDM